MGRVYEVNDMYVDSTGRKAVVGYFVAADTLGEALSKAAALSFRIQLNTLASLFQQRLLVDGTAEPYRTAPSGTVRRRLNILLAADGPPPASDHFFQIFVYDPIPDLLNQAGDEVDRLSPAWLDFEESVLKELVDIHGHPMLYTVQAYVEQS